MGLSLLADDTTVLGSSAKSEEGVQKIKEVMSRFEKSINEDMEERRAFGTVESKDIRMLGVWMRPEQVNQNRIRRAGGLWGKKL